MGKIAYRRVAPDWVHPKHEVYGRERLKPLNDGARFAVDKADWEKQKAKWDEGLMLESRDGRLQWVPIPPDALVAGCEVIVGREPVPENYMPLWTPEQATAWQVYEEVSEGTPISVVYPDLDTMALQISLQHGHSFEAMRKKILATVEFGLWYVPVKEFELGEKYYDFKSSITA